MTMTVTDTQSAVPEAECRWTAFVSRIHATRTRFVETGEPVSLLALIDTRSLPDLRAALTRHAPDALVALWDGTDLAAHQEISPLLIDIGLASEGADAAHALLEHLWRFFEDGFMVTWIWTSLGLAEIAAHLRQYCEYALPDRRSFYLHFYDNRILERLRKVWSPQEWSSFANAAHEIWYRLRSGELETWRVEPGTRPAINAEPLEMTHEQHLALIAHGYADKVAKQLRELYGSNLDHLSPEALHLAVQTQMERATGHGIRDEHDMLFYVTKGLFVSPTFDEHPLTRRDLISARGGDLPLSQVLSKVDDRVWGDYSGRKERV